MDFDDIIAEADATICSIAGKTVEYRRGEAHVDWSCVVGSTTFEVSSEFGLESFESRDFIGAVADLILDDEPIIPAVGDRIYEAIGNTTYIYELSSPPGQPHFHYSDPKKTTVRVHTKYVGDL